MNKICVVNRMKGKCDEILKRDITKKMQKIINQYIYNKKNTY